MVELNLSARQKCSGRDRHVDAGRAGVRRDESKGRIETYTLPCVKQIASGKLLYSAGTSVVCDDLHGRAEGSGGRLTREQKYAYLELTQVVVQQKSTHHCKAAIPPTKNKFLKIKLKKQKTKKDVLHLTHGPLYLM